MVGGGWVGFRVGRSGGLQQGLLASVEKKLLKVPHVYLKRHWLQRELGQEWDSVPLVMRESSKKKKKAKVCTGTSMDGGWWPEIPPASHRAWNDNSVKNYILSEHASLGIWLCKLPYRRFCCCCQQPEGETHWVIQGLWVLFALNSPSVPNPSLDVLWHYFNTGWFFHPISFSPFTSRRLSWFNFPFFHKIFTSSFHIEIFFLFYFSLSLAPVLECYIRLSLGWWVCMWVESVVGGWLFGSSWWQVRG